MEGECAERNFVGDSDWLVGMCTRVGEEFSLADATADYKKMVTDLDEAGPLTRAAFMAQAYGVARARALSGFECMPTYQGNPTCSDALIQYGCAGCPSRPSTLRACGFFPPFDPRLSPR